MTAALIHIRCLNSNNVLFFSDINQSGTIDMKDIDLAVQVSIFYMN